MRGTGNAREDLYPKHTPDSTWQYEITIPEIDVMKTAPTLDSALNITLHDIVKHFMSRSLILVFAEQPDDKNSPSMDPQEYLRTHREDQAAFEVAQQGIAPQVRRREHHFVFAISHPLTRAQTTWLNRHTGKLFDRYYIKDELEVELDTLLDQERDQRMNNS
jgi:hypothetical protein